MRTMPASQNQDKRNKKSLSEEKRSHLEITTTDGFSSNMRDYPIFATSVASSAMEKRNARKVSHRKEEKVKVCTNMGHGSEVNRASEHSTTRNTITAKPPITPRRNSGKPTGHRKGRNTHT